MSLEEVQKWLPPLPQVDSADILVALLRAFPADLAQASRDLDVHKQDEVRAAAIMDYLLINAQKHLLTVSKIDGRPKETKITLAPTCYLVVLPEPMTRFHHVKIFNTQVNPTEPVYDTSFQLQRIAKMPLGAERTALRQRVYQTAETAYMLKTRLEQN